MSPSNKQTLRALQGAPKIIIATIALMEELARVFFLEIDIVSNRRLKEHPEVLKYKQKLAMDYRANMKAIAAEPDLVKKLPADAKEVLKETAQKLAMATEKNALILRTAVSATQQLIQNIVAMVKVEMSSTKPYKNSAKAHLALGTYSPTCDPVSISRTV